MGRILTMGIVILCMLPLIWLLYSAFLPADILLSNKPLVPQWSLENFSALSDYPLFKAMLFSLGLSAVVVVCQLLIALPAAYALWAKLPILGFYLLALSIPSELLLVPLYGILHQAHLIGSPLALILPFLSSPLAVFLLYQGLLKQSWSYVEAARIDGASEWRIVFWVILPLIGPEIAVSAVIGFASHWNMVLFPKVVGNDQLQTVQLVLSDITRQSGSHWGLLGAAAVVTALPLVLLYAVFEKYIVRTFDGGLK